MVWPMISNRLNFANGIVLDAQSIRDKTVSDMKATGTVKGSEFADVYTHTLGDGSYTIDDLSYGSALDQLVFVGVNADDVTFSMNAGLDLVITLSNGETITITDHFDGTQYSGECLQFSRRHGAHRIF